MLNIDVTGKIIHPKIIAAISTSIERGEMKYIKGIIVHQTDSYTAQSSLSSYKNPKANGAHFLIDKDGSLYQTASIYKKTWHIGRLKSRCLLESRCTATELKALQKFSPAREHDVETRKQVPDRYPSNSDSIGIELVGKAIEQANSPTSEPIYEDVTDKQNDSLKWLVDELRSTLKVPLSEVFRHPIAARKNSTEAATAKW